LKRSADVRPNPAPRNAEPKNTRQNVYIYIYIYIYIIIINKITKYLKPFEEKRRRESESGAEKRRAEENEAERANGWNDGRRSEWHLHKKSVLKVPCSY